MVAKSKDALRLREQQMVAGIEKHLASQPSLIVGTESMTPADVVSLFEGRLAKMEATAQALAAYREALKSERDERAKTAKNVAAFKRMVEGMFYASPAKLADFGLKPVSRVSRTVADKAAAVAQSKATREARHTLGPKQKKGIKGEVPPAAPASPTA